MGDKIHNDIVQLRKELKADLTTYMFNVAKHVAKDISKDLTAYSRKVIEDFYDSYDPTDPVTHPNGIYYRRHGNFRELPREYYKKRGDVYICGVDLLVDDIPDVYRGMSSDPYYVYKRVMKHGLHGFASLGYPKGISNIPEIFSPSPYDRILDKYEDIKKNYHKYEEAAGKKAEKDGNYIRLYKS